MTKLSTGEWIAVIVLEVIFTILGYWLSENDRRRFGRTPWGLPSGVWALFWLLSTLLGLVLYLIAHADIVRRARQSPDGRLASGPVHIGMYPGGTPSPPTVSEQFPSYPQPASGPVSPWPVGGNVGEPTVPVGAQGSGQVGGQGGQGDVIDPAATTAEPSEAHAGSPPAWHPDPGGRFHYRWWDGSQWTSYVSYNGQQLIDTSPDQRVGPY